MSAAKVELGRFLFYDTRLSGNGTYACATCHEQARAFTDGKAQAVGSTGERHTRGAMSLANIGYAGSLTWMKQGPTKLEDQVRVPIFGDHPLELGLERPSPALGAVVDAYSAGRRLLDEGAHGFPITADRKSDLIAFLDTLTDTDFLHDARFSDPRRH